MLGIILILTYYVLYIFVITKLENFLNQNLKTDVKCLFFLLLQIISNSSYMVVNH